LKGHGSRTATGQTVLDLGGRKVKLPRADLGRLVRDA
jgi:hypothetical protein